MGGGVVVVLQKTRISSIYTHLAPSEDEDPKGFTPGVAPAAAGDVAEPPEAEEAEAEEAEEAVMEEEEPECTAGRAPPGAAPKAERAAVERAASKARIGSTVPPKGLELAPLSPMVVFFVAINTTPPLYPP